MLWGSDLNRVTTLPTLPTNCPAQFAALFFVGNVGYQFSIANIANTNRWPHGRMATWPHGRTASVCVGIANIANGPLA
jgi:hypothetical protein